MSRVAILVLAAAALACSGAVPASAQEVVEGVYEVGDPDATLDLVQRQALAELREKDYYRYMSTARDARILHRKSVKPITQWTQGDLWKFRKLYDLYSRQVEGLEKWSVHEMATLIRHLTQDGGGEGEGDGDE